tara:strand:+ start:869 stop:1330 length:462 start_codon:yes stop_codon:yes gene_type:complete
MDNCVIYRIEDKNCGGMYRSNKRCETMVNIRNALYDIYEDEEQFHPTPRADILIVDELKKKFNVDLTEYSYFESIINTISKFSFGFYSKEQLTNWVPLSFLSSIYDEGFRVVVIETPLDHLVIGTHQCMFVYDEVINKTKLSYKQAMSILEEE